VLTQGNRPKPWKFQYEKPVGTELHMEDIAIKGQNLHIRSLHFHLIPPHQRIPINIGISLMSPETTDRELHLCCRHYMRISIHFKTIMP